MSRFAGKVALITGASKGIGTATRQRIQKKLMADRVGKPLRPRVNGTQEPSSRFGTVKKR